VKFIFRILWGTLLIGAMADALDVLAGAASAGRNPWQVIVICSASVPVSMWLLARNFRNIISGESPQQRDAGKSIVRSTRNRTGNERQQ
jgi:hypothetical protein